MEMSPKDFYKLATIMSDEDGFRSINDAYVCLALSELVDFRCAMESSIEELRSEIAGLKDE